jgi:hypothetical protein
MFKPFTPFLKQSSGIISLVTPEGRKSMLDDFDKAFYIEEEKRKRKLEEKNVENAQRGR